MNARSEPLLWLQLIAVGVLPLEALLLLLLLAGSDAGPVPGLERLLCWGLGGLLPALGLWRRPADVWSLLLLQTPVRARRPIQQRLSALQGTPVLRAGLVVGSTLLLGLLWWCDDHAAIAGPFSPLAASPRLVAMLLAAPLLAVMLWQWQQLLQSLWLLSRGPAAIAAATPLLTKELEASRLCLGLPLLVLDPLPERLPQSRAPVHGAPPRAPGAAAIKAPAAVSAGSSEPPVAQLETEETGAQASAMEAAPSEPRNGSPEAVCQEPGTWQVAEGDQTTSPAANGAPGSLLEPRPGEAIAEEAVSAAVPESPAMTAPSTPAEPPSQGASAATSSSAAGDPEPPDSATASGEILLPEQALQDLATGSVDHNPANPAPGPLGTSVGPGDGESVPSAAVPVAVEPEQGTKDGEGRDLDQQIG
jgi:hypothetical protein